MSVPKTNSTIAAVIADQTERMAKRRKERGCLRRYKGWPGFTPMELGDWIDLCKTAGVPYVGAVEIATAKTDDLLQFDSKPELVLPFFQDVETAISHKDTVVPYDWGKGPCMVRWSCCASLYVKSPVCSGNHDWQPSFLKLDIDDPRAYPIIFEHPAEYIHAWLRPWIEPVKQDGYPIEFRIFVRDNKVQGISNYYPQIALEDNREVEDWVNICRAYAESLIEAQQQPMNLPMLKNSPLDLSMNQWTADFIIERQSRQPLFLEGGPPNTPVWGAHPCCFEGKKIEGVALKL